MKILILSVTAGGGHYATARAMEDALKNKGADVKVVDIYKYINHFLFSIIDKGCAFSTSRAPDIYGAIYGYLENKNRPQFDFDVLQLVNALCAFRFESFIENFDPDAIICTHVFAAQIINELKKRNKISTPVVGIITDYTIHPYWGSVSHIDYIVLASELLVYRAISRGISKDRIQTFGIPIHQKFNKKMEKTEARRLLDLPENGRMILIMSGSLGQGDMLDISKQIHRIDSKIIQVIVCGKNKKLFTKLSSYKNELLVDNLHVYGFVDNIDIMMDACDCIITKPGGLTVSETLAKRLPMIVIDPIPGHEERNTEFLLNNGVCLEVTKTFPLEEAIYYMFESPKRISMMSEYMGELAHSDSTEELSDFIMELKK
ncbi:MAG: glycosyltransferase [Clostridiales bacterium]|nr:glycosyltransferase [Clostridiales bacterium]